jgi:hypothetical protein
VAALYFSTIGQEFDIKRAILFRASIFPLVYAIYVISSCVLHLLEILAGMNAYSYNFRMTPVTSNADKIIESQLTYLPRKDEFYRHTTRLLILGKHSKDG